MFWSERGKDGRWMAWKNIRETDLEGRKIRKVVLEEKERHSERSLVVELESFRCA